jgi:serine protease Do
MRLPSKQNTIRSFVQVMLALVTLTAFAALAPARAGIVGEPVSPAPSAPDLMQTMETVLVVRTADASDRFLGSAFLWGENAEVAVTNAHVVGQADAVRLEYSDGTTEVAQVIARDAVRDIAVIAVTAGRHGLVAGPAPVLGEAVYAFGAPLGAEFSVTRGMVSARARQIEAAVPIRMLQHDAAVNPGSSGGPLVDAQGRLVGMNSQIADGSRLFIGIAYAISVEDLSRLVPALIAETLLPFPELGLRLRPVTRQIADALGIAPGGVLIDDAAAGGLGRRGGLRAGDVIVRVGEIDIVAAGDLAFAIEAGLEAGVVPVTLRRAGALTEVLLDLKPAPETPGLLGQVAMRDVDLAGGTRRVSSYTLATLGIDLGEGAVVTALTDNSPAFVAGLVVGDRVMAANGAPIDLAALRAMEVTAPLLLLVRRTDGSSLHVMVNPWDKGQRLRPVGGANVLDPEVVVF